jgi:hypothetical protein
VPTKKQRRRQQKLRRHEWEEVWVDAEGAEVADVEPTSGATAAKRNGERRREPETRRGPQPPSFQRAVRRSFIFAAFMFIVIWIATPDASVATRISGALFYALLFVPIAYFADAFAYRFARRRGGGPRKA